MTSGPRTQSSKAATGTLSCIWTMTWCDSGGRRFISLSSRRRYLCLPPHPISKVGSLQQPSNHCAGMQVPIQQQSPPRPDAPAARLEPHGAQDAAQKPLPLSALTPWQLRHPLILRNQPGTTQRSLHWPTVPGSVAAHLLPPRSQQKTKVSSV